jgi:hypothetical protein
MKWVEISTSSAKWGKWEGLLLNRVIAVTNVKLEGKKMEFTFSAHNSTH